MTGNRPWSRQATFVTAVTALAALVAVILAIQPSRGPQVVAADPTPTATASAEAATPPANPSPTATATATAVQPPATPPPAPTLITVATGERGELLLEWTPNTEMLFPTRGVTGWQYRQQFDEPEDYEYGMRDDSWEAWTDVPGSTASTRSHRLTGLARGIYYFQVRAVAGTVEGEASVAVNGAAALVDEHGIPAMEFFQIVEGGRTWRLGYCHTVIDIPAGTRLVLMPGSVRDDGSCWLVVIRNFETGSEQLVDPNDGHFLSREFVRGAEGASGAGKGARGASGRDVVAIFDQIRDSARLVE